MKTGLVTGMHYVTDKELEDNKEGRLEVWRRARRRAIDEMRWLVGQKPGILLERIEIRRDPFMQAYQFVTRGRWYQA